MDSVAGKEASSEGQDERAQDACAVAVDCAADFRSPPGRQVAAGPDCAADASDGLAPAEPASLVADDRSRFALLRILNARMADFRLATASPAAQAYLWIGIGYGAANFLRLFNQVVMARWISKDIFGLMALLMIFQQGLGMFSDVGIGPSIIQHRRGEEPAFLNTAWTIQVARGFLLWLVSCLIAWPLAAIYKQPMMLALIPLTGFMAVIQGFNSTGIFTLKRHLRLKELTILELGTQILGIVVGIAWAFFSPTVWSFVAGMMVSTIFRMGVSHWLDPIVRNRLHWDRSASQALFHFGRWIFICTMITFLAGQSDRLVLGIYVVPGVLGLYSIAFAIAFMPIALVSTLASSVMYPLLSKAARVSLDELRLQLAQQRWILLALGMVMVLGVVVEAPLFFQLLYKEPFHGAGPLAQLMCGWVWLLLLGTTLEPALLAVGDSRSTAFAQAVRFAVSIVTSIAGYYLGEVPGFIMGLMIGALAGHLVLLYCLHAQGVDAARHDLGYTGLAILLGAAACAPRHCFGSLSPLAGEIISQVVLAVVLAATIVVVASRLWRQVFRHRR